MGEFVCSFRICIPSMIEKNVRIIFFGIEDDLILSTPYSKNFGGGLSPQSPPPGYVPVIFRSKIFSDHM